METGMRSDSSLMRGFALQILEAGGPEAWVNMTYEMEKDPVFQKFSLWEPRSPHLCPTCRSLMEDYARRNMRGPLRSEVVVCPRCKSRLHFTPESTPYQRSNKPPRDMRHHSTGSSFTSFCTILVLFLLFFINIPLGIAAVCIYIGSKKE